MESWQLRLSRAFSGYKLPAWVPYSLFMCLGLLLLLPLFINAAGFEASLRNTTLDRAIRGNVVIHFNLAAFSIMAPMLLDHLLDCYAHGLKQEIVERTVFIAVIFSSFLIQYVSSYFNYYAIIFMCFYCLMTWVLFAFYVTLHRISPVATSLRVAILGLTLFCWLFITLMGSVYKDPAVITAGIAFRYISVILIIFLQIAITWDLYRNFRESRMKFSSWVSQRNESEQNAFTISIVLCLHIFFHNIFVVSLNNGLEGFQYRTEKFFLAYYPITLLAFLCITLLPGRILKLHAGRLQGDLESKRVFIRFVSHEIRTPMNVIFMGLQHMETLMAKENVSVQLQLEARELKNACETGTHILNSILFFEKLDAGNVSLNCTLQNPLDIVDTTLRMYQAEARNKRVRLEATSSLPRGGYRVSIDSKRMSQVLGNLVSNALRATPQEGSIEVNVAVNDEDNIVYSVKDTGVGVDPSLAPLLFKDIVDFVPQNHDEEGGAGLGLWISFRIVQLHKGTMGFISPAPNGGSIFYFTLPVAEMVSGSTGSGRTMFRHRGSTFHRALQRITGSNFVLEPSSVHLQVPTTEERPSFHGSQSSDLPDNPPIGPPPPRAPSPAPSSAPSIANSQSFSSGISTPNDGSLIPSSTPRKTSHESVFGVVSTTLLHGEVRLRVLIVDDSKLNRKMMRRCLEDDFYVDEADDGSTAVERLQSRGVAAYDVISMDNMMPIMRGPMATSMIRALGFGGVIIGVTGNALPEEVVDFKENGANAVLLKPLNVDEFKSIIEFHSGNNHIAAQDSDSPVVEEEDGNGPTDALDGEESRSTAGDEAV